MPVSEELVKSSWAEEVEETETSLPPPVEKVAGNTKIVTEYHLNDDGKKVKVCSHYRIETHKVSKSVAKRKLWQKFGLSKNDKPGPRPATTITGEDVYLQFVSNKEEDANDQDDLKKKLLDAQKGQVKCRLCKEDHWTKQCPYKDKLEPLRSQLLGEEAEEDTAATPTASDKKGIGGAGKYVPPSLREGGPKKGDSMISNRVRDETSTIRVTNLSEDAKETDLHKLFGEVGEISRTYIGKDKITGMPKGFAFVTYKGREDASRPIQMLNGRGWL